MDAFSTATSSGPVFATNAILGNIGFSLRHGPEDLDRALEAIKKNEAGSDVREEYKLEELNVRDDGDHDGDSEHRGDGFRETPFLNDHRDFDDIPKAV